MLDPKIGRVTLSMSVAAFRAARESQMSQSPVVELCRIEQMACGVFFVICRNAAIIAERTLGLQPKSPAWWKMTERAYDRAAESLNSAGFHSRGESMGAPYRPPESRDLVHADFYMASVDADGNLEPWAYTSRNNVSDACHRIASVAASAARDAMSESMVRESTVANESLRQSALRTMATRSPD